MQGPSTAYRQEVFARLEAITTEDELEDLLGEMSAILERSLGTECPSTG